MHLVQGVSKPGRGAFTRFFGALSLSRPVGRGRAGTQGADKSTPPVPAAKPCWRWVYPAFQAVEKKPGRRTFCLNLYTYTAVFQQFKTFRPIHFGTFSGFTTVTKFVEYEVYRNKDPWVPRLPYGCAAYSSSVDI